MTDLTVPAAHLFSKLVFLNPPDSGSQTTVGSLAEYYLNNAEGCLRLQKRFPSPDTLAHWKSCLENDVTPYQEWRITDILDDNLPYQTGFYGCSYVSLSEERVIAFRGSEMLGNADYQNDYINDFALSYQFPTPQQHMVDTYWNRYGHNCRNNIMLTGHSLGGNLAVYGMISAPEQLSKRIVRCCSFNGPGFCSGYIKENRARIEKRKSGILLVQNRYDLISSMLDQVTEPLIAESEYDPYAEDRPTISNLLKPHSNFLLKTDENGMIQPAWPAQKSELCNAVHRLTELIQLLPVKTRMDLSSQLIDILYHQHDGDRHRKALNALTHCFRREAALELGTPVYSAIAMQSAAGSNWYEEMELHRNNPQAAALAMLMDVSAGMAVRQN